MARMLCAVLLLRSVYYAVFFHAGVFVVLVEHGPLDYCAHSFMIKSRGLHSAASVILSGALVVLTGPSHTD